jgi:predicted chitinase
MDYKKAKDLRGKSFSERMAENLISGSGIGESFKKTLSEKSKARMTGIKEKFDPLNIAKALTGGSRLGPALLGKMTGRSQQDLQYFAGDPKKQKLNQKSTTGLSGKDLEESTESLGRIYDLLKRDRDSKLRQRQKKQNFEEGLEAQEELRNQELIKALTARRKKTPKEKRKEEVKQKEAERKEKKQEEKAPEKPPAKAPEKPPAKAPEKPPAKAPEKPPAKAPEKPPAKAPAPKPEKPPTAAPAPKPEVKPPTAAPAPKPEVKPPTAAPAPTAKPPTAAKLPGKEGVIQAGKGVIGVLTAALVSAGITNAYAQKAILANVGKETGFKPRNEDLKAYANTSNKRIREVFTTRAAKYTDEQLDQIKKDEYKFAEMVYGKDTAIGQSMGNKEEGDGYKYRGRGAIQLTGKNNYKAYSKVAEQDLVINPELVNQPDIDYKIVAEFVKKGTGGKLDFQSQSEANRAVTQAIGGKKLNLDVGVGAKILQTVNEYSTALDNVSNAGSQIDQSSKENKNLKEDAANKDRPAINVNNNTTNVQKQSSPSSSAPSDDRPAYMQKTRG